MFENRMIDARKRLGLTQKQVADKAQIQPTTYSTYETNKKTPPLDIALRIAKALDVSLEWLCGVKTEREISTYGDIIRCLNGIKRIMVDKSWPVSISPFLKPDPAIKHVENQQTVVLQFASPILFDYFQKSKQFYSLISSSNADHELIDTWYKSKLEELSKIPIENNPHGDEVYPF